MTVLLRRLLLISLLGMGLDAGGWAEETWSGEALYYGCSACHGVKGEGVEARQAPKVAGLKTGYLERQMNNFKAGIRGDHPEDIYGGQMILFARTLGNDEEIMRLALYIASLPHKPARQTIKGNLDQGREIYGICVACHGQRGEGNQDFGAPRLAGMDDWYLVEQLRNFSAGVRGYSDSDRFGKGHATWTGRLSDDASIMDVVAYINFLGTNDSISKRGLSAK